MVPGIIKEKLELYLTRHGLVAADIPWVLGTFSICKGLTTVGFIGAGIRFRPLSHLIRRHFPTLRERVAEGMQQELSRTKGMKTDYANRLRRARDAFSAGRERFQDARQALRESERYQTAKKRLRKSEKRVGERFAEWYVRMSDKYSDKLATTWMWAALSRLARQEPRELARKFGVGAVEGLLLNKLLFLVTAPTELYLVVRFYQWRRARLMDLDPSTPPAPHDGTGTDNTNVDPWNLASIATSAAEDLKEATLRRQATAKAVMNMAAAATATHRKETETGDRDRADSDSAGLPGARIEK